MLYFSEMNPHESTHIFRILREDSSSSNGLVDSCSEAFPGRCLGREGGREVGLVQENLALRLTKVTAVIHEEGKKTVTLGSLLESNGHVLCTDRRPELASPLGSTRLILVEEKKDITGKKECRFKVDDYYRR